MGLYTRIGGVLKALDPGMPFELEDSVVEVPLVVPGSDHSMLPIDCVEVSVGDVSRSSEAIIWRPFEHAGAATYGISTIWYRDPWSRESSEYRVEIRPGRLAQDNWRALFDDLRALADPLLTSHYSADGVHLRIVRDDEARFSAAIALRQLDQEWPRFVESAARVVRCPRRDFTPGRPQSGRSPRSLAFAPTLQIYENALVFATFKRLLQTLRAWEASARTQVKSDEFEYWALKDSPNGQRALMTRIEEGHRVLESLRGKQIVLVDLIRRLPCEAYASAIRGLTPHLTVRIQLHPDYRRILSMWRRFGRERVVTAESKWLSSLPARRGSTLFEYWSFVALVRSLERLGYRAEFRYMTDLVREEAFDPALGRKQGLALRDDKRGETITIWYERVARRVAKGEKKREDWLAGLSEAHESELVARKLPQTPDLWLEIARDDGAVVAAVGDAIFASGLLGDELDAAVYAKKVEAVHRYSLMLARTRPGSPPITPHPRPFIVFCGAPGTAERLDERADHDVTCLPFLPRGGKEQVEARRFEVGDDTLSLVRGYLEMLRESFPQEQMP